MFRFIFCIVMLCGFASVQAREESGYNGKEYHRTSIRHIESGGIGYDDGYTTLDTFIVLDPLERLITPIFNLRSHFFDKSKWAANVGVGLRALWGGRVYGINTFYDYRKTCQFNWNQMGIGLESFGELYDFRINAYLPTGRTTNLSNPLFVAFSGHNMLIFQKNQSAMSGFDAEYGFHLGSYQSFDFYAAAGPYYYTGKVDPDTFGGKVRFNASFKDILSLEISNSYDRTFHNNFQGQIALNFSFGPGSTVQQQRTTTFTNTPKNLMIQPIHRQEIIVINKTSKTSVAINPLTGLPFVFVFVNNTSSSNGTYESPYPTLLQAQNNSSPNDVIYVFPGDGTTTGMASGITLQAKQKFWGSGVNHPIQTTLGTVNIPAQSSTSPIITNTNIDTVGDAVTLSTNNAVSGFTISSARNDAIFGTDPQSLEVSNCTFQGTTTYVIQASFPSDASVSITNNQFVDNTNGIALTLLGNSTVDCLDNTFTGQTSGSSIPIEISTDSNRFTANIERNVFNNNRTGSIRVDLDTVVDANINMLNNTITNNGTGDIGTLGSSVVILATGTSDNCSIALNDNTFSGNTSNSFYMHTSGDITTLAVTASGNTMTDNGGSGLDIATPSQNLTFHATDNIISRCNDNGIALISSGITATGTVVIDNNSITDVRNASNGIAINQNFTTLDLTISNNEINRCEGSGIVSYASTGIDTLKLQVSDNTINNCQNLSSNSSSGLSIDQFVNFEGTVTNNTLLDNTGIAVVIGSSLPAPVACLTLTGNDSSTDYQLNNPVDGTFYLSPCNAEALNVGTINTSGTIDAVQSCSNPVFCTP